MKYTILLFALLFWKTSLFGQELKVQGHLIDENKRDLVAATIRCYMNDTLFMIGGSTNSKGEFELKLPRTEQKYMAGRLRTASSPSNTWMPLAE